MVKKRRASPKTLNARLKSFGKARTLNRKVLRQGPRPVLDLRRRPEREVPVKQHGFKEGEVSSTNILNQ